MKSKYPGTFRLSDSKKVLRFNFITFTILFFLLIIKLEIYHSDFRWEWDRKIKNPGNDKREGGKRG